MLDFYDRWNGLIPLLGGIYCLLLAYRVVLRKPKDPERMELWHRKFDRMMKVIGPVLIVFGILLLCGVLK